MHASQFVMCVLAALLLAAAQAGAAAADEAGAPIHSVTDISHEFTFYFDGRFARNYLAGKGNVDVRNWGTLHKLDLSNVNLLVLPSGASPCPYLAEDVEAVRKFLEGGGGVAVLGDYALFREEKAYRLNELAGAFGAELAAQRAKAPLSGAGELKGKPMKTYGGKTLRLAEAAAWDVLIQDAAGAVVAARRAVGKGKLLVCSRALVGRRPDAKDPIWSKSGKSAKSGKTGECGSVGVERPPAPPPPHLHTAILFTTLPTLPTPTLFALFPHSPVFPVFPLFSLSLACRPPRTCSRA